METNQKITVTATINATVAKVWEIWNEPQHITQWNAASEDWHTTHAENNLKVGGQFLSRMEARDGSAAFDFIGTYNEIEHQKLISYTIADGRKVSVTFKENGLKTSVTETFDPENIHSRELQVAGWQAILNNFKKYAEAN